MWSRNSSTVTNQSKVWSPELVLLILVVLLAHQFFTEWPESLGTRAASVDGLTEVREIRSWGELGLVLEAREGK